MTNSITDIYAELGEGLYIDTVNNYLYWVDISKNFLFFGKPFAIKTLKLQKKITSVLYVDYDLVYLVSSIGIITLNTSSGSMSLIDKTPYEYSSDEFRSNDGVRIYDNFYIYGVMNKEIRTPGAIIISKNNNSYIVDNDIYIPNTFIKIPGNNILISDSFKKKIYKFQFTNDWKKLQNKSVWLDLSQENFTPDGGCISSKGKIYVALWDGFAVLELNIKGDIIQKLEIPVPKPTNCALDSTEEKLYVSSAYEGLSKSMRAKYPLSGSVIEIDLRRNVN